MDIDENVIKLLRTALDGRTEEVRALGRVLLAKIQKNRPDLERQTRQVAQLLANKVARSALAEMPMPVDHDSRLNLMRREDVPDLPLEPTWPPDIRSILETVVAERAHEALLLEKGLNPTRSLLLVGPPGVGKTLSARWLARRLGRPLLTLDLAAVMSSLLGRTGNNIRVVLDYARRIPSVLLLDEFDAIAKRRDDLTEIGELKRLVTVLLQAVDDWPASGILLAATNHPELLDPAVWRRFDHVLRFPLPSANEIRGLLKSMLSGETAMPPEGIDALVAVSQGRSFADITREIQAAHRRAILSGKSFPEIVHESISETAKSSGLKTRLVVARELLRLGYTQCRVAEVTGLSRSTLRKHFPPDKTQRRRKSLTTRTKDVAAMKGRSHES